MQDDLEEIAIVVPGITALLESGLQARIDMAKPHFLVEKAEDVVVLDVGSNHVDGGPVALLEQAVAEFLEAALVHLVDLVHVLFADVAIEIDNKGLDDIRDIGGGVEAGLGGLQVAEAVTKLGAIVVGVVVTAAVVAGAIVSHGEGRCTGTAREERGGRAAAEGSTERDEGQGRTQRECAPLHGRP